VKTPQFTDTHRFVVPYRPHDRSDIRKTFARLRRQADPTETNAAARPAPGAPEQRSAK